jgi:4-hydroxy-2-oxoglutarate aldolase
VRPEIGIKLWQNGMRGQDEAGLEYHNRMKEANKKISGEYGVPGVKAAMDLVGLHGGYPRLPLTKLEGQDRENIKQALQEAELL